jgi:N-acyl homoserine lactone hydrolase
MTATYTIKPILTGWQYLDKGLYATFRDGIGTILQHPVFAWLIEGGGHKYLVDTGMASTEISQKYHHDGRQDPGTAIHEQLAKLGIEPDEIEAIIFTHLHWDHCYNMKEFRNAKYYVSDIEYAFALDPIPPYWNSYEHPNAGLTPPFHGCHFETISGEEEVFGGIRIVPTPGHSPGHISVSINTEKGDYWIVGDLMFLRENLEPDKKHGWPLTPPGRFSSFIEIWHSMEKAINCADFILMTHDPLHLEQPVYPIPE